LTTNIEGRLAALTTSTPVNGFQRLLFLRLISEANASGMVSIQNLLLRVWWLGLIGFGFDGVPLGGWLGVLIF
jgi:hypothetical protein